MYKTKCTVCIVSSCCVTVAPSGECIVCLSCDLSNKVRKKAAIVLLFLLKKSPLIRPIENHHDFNRLWAQASADV